MASKKGGKCKRSYYQAKLVTNVGTCVFCQRAVDDEIVYGKLYAIGDIQCHYFCALLSCCLVQKGSDEEGLFGFLYPDILAEVERSKKHRCSYCNREGASLGCSVSQCRKQFHLPCGRERDAVSLFYGNYKSFCALHAPKQKIVDSIIPYIKLRMAEQRRQKQSRCSQKSLPKKLGVGDVGDIQRVAEILCVICYEQVEGFPTSKTFWPPCCARDAWFHRSCLQRMALSAGMHYLKCPLCNDKEEFCKAVLQQGYYIPDRDAAWELEQNAFAEIYERSIVCGAETCKCPTGRDHDSDTGLWDIKLCILCGSTAIHAGCTDNTEEQTNIYICSICKPAAPGDLEKLIASIEKVQLQEQAAETVRNGPVMPSRMSLRRTKPAIDSGASSSRILSQNQYMASTDSIRIKTEASRLELNLKKPVRRIFEPTVKNIDNILLSPIKVLELGLSEKMDQLHTKVMFDSSKVLEKLRDKLKKPRPLVAKKKIINNILDELLSNTLHDQKSKEALKEWNSPKRTYDISAGEKEIVQDARLIETIITEEKPFCDNNNSVKCKSISLQYVKVDTEKERVCRNDDFKCNFKHKHIESISEGSKLRTAIDFAIDAHKENKRKLPEAEAVPNKKRKVNCSLKRNVRDPNEIDDFVETANAGFEKVGKILEDVKEFKKEGNETDDNSIDKIIYDSKDEPLKEAVTKNKRIVISCSSKEKAEKESLVTATELEMVNNKCNFAETEENIELEMIQKLAERKVEFREETNAEDDTENNEIDKTYVGSELKTLSKTKVINYRLKRKKGKELIEKTLGMNMENINCDFVEAKGNIECENTNKLKDNVEDRDIIEIDIDKIDKRSISDEHGKKINKSKIERRRNYRNKNNDNRTRKKRSKNEKGFKSLKSNNEHVDLTLNDNSKILNLKYKNKHKKKLSIQNKDIKVKFKWKKEQFKLKIMGKKEKKKRSRRDVTPKVFKQYILKYSPDVTSPKEMIIKPDTDFTPVKRVHVKTEKRADNMIQTNISSFFKATPKVTTLN